jgi:hypothetical protein
VKHPFLPIIPTRPIATLPSVPGPKCQGAGSQGREAFHPVLASANAGTSKLKIHAAANDASRCKPVVPRACHQLGTADWIASLQPGQRDHLQPACLLALCTPHACNAYMYTSIHVHTCEYKHRSMRRVCACHAYVCTIPYGYLGRYGYGYIIVRT